MIKLAFYKGEGTVYSKLIRWWTRGKYSHVEIVVGSYQYSSIEGIGVRKEWHKYDRSEWDYVDVYDLNIDDVLEFFEMTKGHKYDKIGILGFIIPLKDRTNEWFCSEWCSNALKISGYKVMWNKEPSKISPNKLYKMLTKG